MSTSVSSLRYPIYIILPSSLKNLATVVFQEVAKYAIDHFNVSSNVLELINIFLLKFT